MPDNQKVSHYNDLLVWKRGMHLAQSVYELTSGFPAEERYGLCAQMRRAAVSVPSNIAEGQARRGTREFLQFLSHASGSLAELETQMLLSEALGYCRRSTTTPISAEISEMQRMLAAIRRKLADASHLPLATSHSGVSRRA